MSMTIPQIRERLHELAMIHLIPELAILAEETKRRNNGRRRAPVVATKVTPAIRMSVADLMALRPDLGYSEVGRRFNIDKGRVSEILFGKR